MTTPTLDSDQHLFESRSLWRDHADPGDREAALAILDDDAGNAWVTWQGTKITLAHVTHPGDPDDVGRQQARARRQSERVGVPLQRVRRRGARSKTGS